MKTAKPAFTLVELLVALSICSIILGAIATLAFALGSANDTSSDLRLKQSQLRSCSMHIAELVRNSRLVLASYTNTIALWKADSNRDNKINSNEIIFLKTNDAKTIIEYKYYDNLMPGNEGWSTTIANVQNRMAEQSLDASWERDVVTMLPCSNVVFRLDRAAPRSRKVMISFDMLINGHNQPCYLDYSLLSPAFNLLTPTQILVLNDED